MGRLAGTSPLAVTLPKGGGDVRGLGGSFVPDLNRGTGSYRLDLSLPPGVAGFAPALTLTYTSGGANGAFGLGWSLGVPKIQRDGERAFPRYDDADALVLDAHGELVRLADGTYRPAVDELFARIRRTGDGGWELRHREGVVHRLGIDDGGRIRDPDHPDRVLAWALQLAEDRNGNRISYRYRRDANNLYLEEVAYAVYRVVFHYLERPDAYGTARHGFPIQTRLRCHRIELHGERPAPATLLRRYELRYEEPAEVPLSLLAEIRCSGHRPGAGGEQVDATPALTFGYSRFRPGERRLRSFAAAGEPPPPPVGGIDLLDFSGQGLPDVVHLDGTRSRTWRNRGDGSWGPPRPLAEIPAGVRLAAPGVTFGDVDGDGRTDLLATAGARAGYFPNLGTGAWGRFRAFRTQPMFALDDPNTRPVDLDADGLLDVLRTGPNAFVLYLNDGRDGWARPMVVPRVRDLARFPDVVLADPRVHLADMTGDGLADVVLVHSGSVWYWPYEGLGRWGERRAMRSPPVLPRLRDPRRLFLADVNGDGLADVVYVDDGRLSLWLNRSGDRFAPPVTIRRTPSTAGAHVRLVDLLGSGQAGIVWSAPPSRRDHRNYSYLDFTGQEKPYLLTRVENGLGGETEIRYTTSAQEAARDRRAGRPWAIGLPYPVQVVTRTVVRDRITGHARTSDYRYRDGLHDPDRRRFVGFAEVTIEEHGDGEAPGLRTVARFDQTPLAGLGKTERTLARARWGKPVETTHRTGDGATVLRTLTGRWEATLAATGADGTPVAVVHQVETRAEVPGGGEGPLVVVREYAFDDRGNVVRERTEANGPTPLVKQTEVTYAAWADGEPSAAPARVVETDGAGRVTAEFRVFYDGPRFVGLPEGRIERGNPTRRAVRVLGEDEFAAHYGPEGLTPAALGYRVEDGIVWTEDIRREHDGRGNAVAALDPLGGETRLEFDADGLLPLALRDAAGHRTRFHWDERAVQPDRVEDPNGAVTRFGFDALGRLRWIASPGDSPADPTETVVYHLAARPPRVDLTQKLTGGFAPRAHRRVFYDADDREFQRRARVDAQTVVVSPWRRFNARGWLAREGEPTYGGDMEFAEPPAGRSTAYRYDPIGQVVGASLPGERQTRTVFEPFRTVVYDANDSDPSPANVGRGFFDTPTVRRLDGWGRVVAVTETTGGLLTTHRYAYDAAGRLTAVDGPGGGTWLRQTFDLAGNRVRLDHRDAGRRTFFVDAGGRIVRVLDAAGNRVDRDYDALGRPTQTRVNGTPRERFFYDDPNRPNQRGRLSRVEDEAGTWELSYDPRGRLTGRTLRAGGRAWTLAFGYGPSGLPGRLGYPDGTEIGFVHDRAGRLTRIPDYLEEVSYDPRGRRTALRYANGVTTQLDYDPDTAYLRRARVVGPGGQRIEDITYGRDNVGNVLTLLDGRPPGPTAPHPRRFAYDARYRLLEVAGGEAGGGVAPYVRRYRYDPAGNPTRFPTHGDAPIVYDPPASSRLAGIVGGGQLQRLYEHDANGNLTRLPGRTLRFDPLGRLVGVERDDGTRLAHRYAHGGDRVWRTQTRAGVATTTLFLGGVYEEDGDGTRRRYVPAGRTLVAAEVGGERTFLHANDLGHVTVLTDGAGVAVGPRVFHPYGETDGAATALPTFGGKPFDAVSGLSYFGARFYAPEIGRFVSPDPLALMRPEAGVLHPELLNVYAFAGNNPLAYVDPDGLSLAGAILGGFVGALVGGLVFVVSAGNPVLAGVAGGLAGGAIAGAIDGGVRGAVIGGLTGGIAGGLGGLALWGVSALGAGIGGAHGRLGATLVFSEGLASVNLGLGFTAVDQRGDWGTLAAMAAGFVGGFVGFHLGNDIMMRHAYQDLNTSPRVRELSRDVQQRLGGDVDVDHVTYRVGDIQSDPAAYGSEQHHVVTLSQRRLENSYLKFRETMAHELKHHHQEHTVRWFDDQYSSESIRMGYWNNKFEVQARAFAMRYTGYVPYPFEMYSTLVQPAVAGLVRTTELNDADRR